MYTVHKKGELNVIDWFAHVRIKETGITGIVVDIHTIEGTEWFIVESDEEGTPGGYGDDDSWKLYDCVESELEVIEE